MYAELRNERIILLADVHPSSSVHENMINILKNIKTKDTVVGLEMFGTDEQEILESFGNDKLTLDSLFSPPFCEEERGKSMKKAGYSNILQFLKDTKTPILGINMPYPTVIYNNDIIDAYGNDLSAASITAENIQNGKKVLLIVGELHCYEKRLPALIKKLTNINPVIVFQIPYNATDPGNLSEEYERLSRMGLTQEFAVKFNNNFYMNTKINANEIKEYIFQMLK